MQNTINQDTTTQAMTEVALGLSMAFFAILIVALLSMGVPPSEDAETGAQATPDTENKFSLVESRDTSEPQGSATASPEEQPQFVFLYEGNLYNSALKPFEAAMLEKSQPVYLAVPANAAMDEVIKVKARINHPNLSITLLNQAWKTRLEQLP